MGLLQLLGMSAPHPAAATDPYFSNVVLLLHMDGSNGGTTFTDSSSYGRTISVAGAAQTSTTQIKYGSASGYFAGTTNDYISAVDAAELRMGTSDFTIEGWLYANSTTGFRCVLCKGDGSVAAGYGINLAVSSGSLVVYLSSNGTSWDISTALSFGTISTGQWYHFALVRAGSTFTTFLAGTKANTASSANTIFDNSAKADPKLWIGSDPTTEKLNAYIDDLRITKGIARYTNNFTVPSAAFPNAGNAPYATWNPSDKGAGITLSGGNLIATCVASNTSCRATLGKSSGKWYWEVVSTSNQAGIGVSKSTDVTSTWVGGGTNSYGWYGADGKLYNNGSGLTPANGTYTTNTLGFALDMDNGTLYCYLDNVLQPKIITGLSGTYYPGVGNNTAFSATANFGQNPLTYTPPNGTFWNPKDGDFVDYAFSNNNMVATKTGSTTNGNLRSNTSKSAGKLYFEVSNATSAANLLVGIETLAEINYPGSSNGYSYYATTGNRFANGAQLAYGATFTAGDLIGVAIDFANGKIFFSKNGTWQNSGDPVAGTGYAATGISGTYYIGIGRGTTGGIAVSTNLNTGATPFAYTPPSGYSAWDTTVYNAGVY